MSALLSAPIARVREHLGDVVDQAVADQPTVITRRGKEVAAVVSIDEYRRYRAWEEGEINAIIDARMADSRPGIPLEDVMRETLARDE